MGSFCGPLSLMAKLNLHLRICHYGSIGGLEISWAKEDKSTTTMRTMVKWRGHGVVK